MSVKSNLELARKYEWNAMLAKNQNDIANQQRYESMARMAMIDAGIQYQKPPIIESQPVLHSTYYYDNNSSENYTLIGILSFVGTLVFILGLAYLGSIFL